MGLSDISMDLLGQNDYKGSGTPIRDDNMIAKQKSVVLWGSEDILISSVESILSSHDDWEVVSISNKQGMDSLIQAVESHHAHIVIMQQGVNSDPTFLPMLLVKAMPSLKVITVSLENNSMEVFSKQQIWVKDVSDLISIFENEP